MKGSGDPSRITDANEDLTEELRIRDDIFHSINVFDPDDLITGEEINEGMVFISEPSKTIRYIHVKVIKNLPAEQYGVRYPDYGEKSENWLML